MRGYSTKSPETELGRHLKTRIKATGPITVAEYMRDVLTNPVSVSKISITMHAFLH